MIGLMGLRNAAVKFAHIVLTRSFEYLSENYTLCTLFSRPRTHRVSILYKPIRGNNH